MKRGIVKSKTLSGGRRLKLSGKRAVLIGLTPEQSDIISRGAKLDGRPVTQFLTHYGILAATKLLKI